MFANRAVLALRALLLPDLGGSTISLTPLRGSVEWRKARPADQEAYELVEGRMSTFLGQVGMDCC